VVQELEDPSHEISTACLCRIDDDSLISSHSKYSLGLKLDHSNGTYRIVADEELIGGRSGTDGYGTGDPLREILGENCALFKKEYEVQSIMTEYGYVLAENPDMELQREELPDGRVVLRMFDRNERAEDQVQQQISQFVGGTI